MCKEDHNTIESFIKREEESYINLKRRCMTHSIFCDDCFIKGKYNSLEEEELIIKSFHLQKCIPLEDGTFKLRQETLWRSDPSQTFNPQNSNIKQAAAAAKSLLLRLKSKAGE